MRSEFSRWFKEAVDGHAATGYAQDNEAWSRRGERYLYATGVWNGDVAFSAELGQVVWIEVKNVNVLGTTITIDSGHLDGDRSMHLFPFASHTFRFNSLTGNVVGWSFRISTISDAFVVQYAIYSTWVPGLPRPIGG